VPRKNIADVAGRPLIAWTIAAALASRVGLRVVVTTDCPEIACVSRSHGAEIPFLRPGDLAWDDTPGMPPLLHALEWLETNEGYRPETVLCLQPTSPLRTADDIDQAFAILEETAADSVVSVTQADPHPFLVKRLTDTGYLVDFVVQDRPVERRQDYPPAYALNGAIYLTRASVVRAEGTMFPARTVAQVMPRERSLDIDTPWDLHLARLILEHEGAHERQRVSRVA
jgi:N-acylneuraminate cytidylyltransferase/CMP-N,N'-diacetyllegionaminic acid synthase